MIRVLIADESDRITENVVRRLDTENDIVVAGTCKDGEYAVQEALRLQPDVAIIDTGLPGLDGVQTTEMLAQHLPNTGVIMTSMEGENEAYRRAMLAGAREYLQKPFTGDELVAAVHRVHAFQLKKSDAVSAAAVVEVQAGRAAVVPIRLGQVFTVMSGKGGVGKSVVATNLAIALASQAKARVVLCDLSLQFGDVAALLNLPIEKSIVDLAENDAVTDPDVIRDVLADGPEGIKVLVAPVSPELADYVTTQHLRVLLEELRQTFDFVVIDGPSYLNEITLEALESADAVVLITDLSVTAVKNTRLLLAVMDVLKVDEHRINLVDNHHRGELGGLDKAAAESHLKHPIALQIPHDVSAMETSISRGVPLMVASPTSPAADAIRQLAKHLVPTIPSTQGPPETPAPPPLKKKQRRILGFAKS
jgi:pilus assembly protein CpaE